jgi:multidrug resistance efflux pump
MHLQNRKRIIPIVALLIVIAGGAYYAWTAAAATSGPLTATGTIEATDVIISPEAGGRVAEVLVEKGQAVQAGDVLLRLDDSLLAAQKGRAEAGLQAAQANLKTAQDGLAAAQAGLTSAQVTLEAAQAAAEAERLPAQKALDDLSVNAPAQRGEAARAVAGATRAVRDATYMLDNFTVSSLQEKLTPTEGLSLTKKLLDEARAAFEPYRNESESNERREDLKDDLDNAQSEYDSAVRRIELNAAYDAAVSRLHKAEDDLGKLKDGPNPQDVAILQARLQAIDAGPKQAQAGVDAAQVAVQSAQSRVEAAQAALGQAQAELALLDVQIGKLTVTAPSDGVVLTRSIEPGEVAAAGAALMTIGRLDTLKLTVYLPEARFGEVALGQTAQVAVDSFPGQTFSGTITAIADKAEFTPRNVQTVEGRRNTVYAIELTIANPDGKLKPGMPADVSFGN